MVPPSENREYDPDQQLEDLLDNRGHLSMFDATRRSKRSRSPRTDERSRISNKSGLQVSLYINTGCRLINAFSQSLASIPTFDPVIIEDTAELDRAIEAGHIQLNESVPPPRPSSHPVPVGLRRFSNQL